MPMPLTVSCFSKVQIGFSLLVPAHPSGPGQRVVKWVCVCLRSVSCRQPRQPVCELPLQAITVSCSAAFVQNYTCEFLLMVFSCMSSQA